MAKRAKDRDFRQFAESNHPPPTATKNFRCRVV